MSRKAGALLWNRMQILLSTDNPTDVDTGITQPNRSFPDYSPNEPPLGVETVPPGPPAGTLPASRIQVIPMSPTVNWLDVTHGEPYFDPTTGTIHVNFSTTPIPDIFINVLFWDPHSIVGPGEADTYNPPVIP